MVAFSMSTDSHQRAVLHFHANVDAAKFVLCVKCAQVCRNLPTYPRAPWAEQATEMKTWDTLTLAGLTALSPFGQELAARGFQLKWSSFLYDVANLKPGFLDTMNNTRTVLSGEAAAVFLATR